MDPSPPSSIVIVGGGPAGLMAAEVAASAGHRVTLCDQMPSLGRKFLMAGRGGLNLTHSEHFDVFLSRYRDGAAHLRHALEQLPPDAVRRWCEGLGQPTFVGTSGRIFPTAMKASPLLRAWLRRLADTDVEIRTRAKWTGWGADGALEFDTPGGRETISADATILALGGASWPRLGSTGDWATLLVGRGIDVAALRPANCGFLVAWSDVFKERFQGQPLKRIALSFGSETQRGEALITDAGIEGGAVYALSAPIRDAIAAHGQATAYFDLRPDQSIDELERRLTKPRGKQSMATFLRKCASLSPVEIGLLNETSDTKLADLTPRALAELLKRAPLRLHGTAPLETAISSAGGVCWNEVDNNLMLKQLPGVFVAGEMLDWEAPTGGYLLQACLATGALAGRGAVNWLTERSPTERSP